MIYKTYFFYKSIFLFIKTNPRNNLLMNLSVNEITVHENWPPRIRWIQQYTKWILCTGLQHLYCPRMEDEEYEVSTVDKLRLTYDGPDLEIIERIRRMYERVPFGKSKDDEVEGDRKKKRRKPKFLVRLKTDAEFKKKIILTAGLLWSFMILVSGETANLKSNNFS